MTIADIQDEVMQDLTTELQDEPNFSNEILAVKVKNAIRDVKLRRNYSATSYDEEQIASDLYNFYSVIVDLARYDYNKIGSEGESSHSENGVSRAYVSRDSILGNVYAFVNVL